jgi:hypothetical protein
LSTQLDDALLYAMSPTCAPELLEGLATHPDAAIRAAVAANPSCPAEVFITLVGDNDPTVRAACVLRMVGDGDPSLCVLVGDNDPTVRGELATHSDDPVVLTTLAGDSTPPVRAAVAANRFADVETVTALAGDTDPTVAAAAAAAVSERMVKVVIDPVEPGWIHAELHDEVVDVTAALSGDVDERLHLAAWRNCPASALATLAGSAEEFVRATTASHPSCDNATVDALVADQADAVRASAVCRRPDRAATILTGSSMRPEASPLVLRTAASSCDDEAVLAVTAAHPDPGVRAAVAANAATGPATLAALMHDPVPAVAVTAVTHPNVTFDPAMVAALGESAAVVTAARSDLDEVTVMALAASPNWAVRRQVAVAQTKFPSRLDGLALGEILDAGVGSWPRRLWELSGIDPDGGDAERLTDMVDGLAGTFAGTLAELAVVVAACR